MLPIPPETTDILRPLLVAAMFALLAADRGEKEPDWRRYVRATLLMITSIAGMSMWILHLHWYVPKRIGDPMHSGLTLVAVVAAILFIFKFARTERAAAAKKRLAKTVAASGHVGEDAF